MYPDHNPHGGGNSEDGEIVDGAVNEHASPRLSGRISLNEGQSTAEMHEVDARTAEGSKEPGVAAGERDSALFDGGRSDHSFRHVAAGNAPNALPASSTGAASAAHATVAAPPVMAPELASLQDRLGLAVRDQAALELDMRTRMDNHMAEQIRADEARRLDKVRKKIADLHEKLASMDDRIERAPISRRTVLRRKMKSMHEELAVLMQDEEEILARIREASGSNGDRSSSPADDDAGSSMNRDKLIRKGLITPFGTTGNLDAEQISRPLAKTSVAAVKRSFETFSESEGTSDSASNTARAKARQRRQGARKKKPEKRRRRAESSASASAASEDDYEPSDASGEGTTSGSEGFVPSDVEPIEDGDPSMPAHTSYHLVHDDGLEEHYQKRLIKWSRFNYRQRTGSNPTEVATDYKPEKELFLHGALPDVQIDKGLVMPATIYDELFQYQVTCIRWLWELHQQQVGGIVGDEMGLGKTVQIVAFLASLLRSELLQKPVLIVCPATVMAQWVTEFHRWFPPMRVVMLHSSGAGAQAYQAAGDDGLLVPEPAAKPNARRTVQEAEWDEDLALKATYDAKLVKARQSQPWVRALVNKVVRGGHVLITTYAGIRIYAPDLLPVPWGYVVLDEGHKIRNPDAEVTIVAKQIRTPHRIILSGTPIQNSLSELWALMDFVYPGRLGTLPVFLTEFAVPINIGGYANASNVQVQTAYKCACILRDLIQPYMLRRMKADVAQDLPQKSEQVLFCKLLEGQRQMYRKFLKSKDVSDILEGKRNALFGIDTLRKICNHPALAFKNKDFDPELSGKMVVVRELLKLWHAGGDHKVLLFTQTRQMLDILENMVTGMKLRYLRMDGATSIKNRPALVDKFNNDKDVFLFLLTTKVGGLGVNLTGANRIIIYDPDWNPSTDMQARERAWRVGQTRHVTIYRLMTTGTIEEKVFQRQLFKSHLTNKILKDPKQRRFFRLSDLHDLFTLTEEENEGPQTADIFVKAQANHVDEDTVVQDLEGVARMEQYKPPQGEKGANESSSDKAGSKDSSEESRILASLLDRGVQSALQHDALMESARPEFVLVEQEAQRVADAAVAALRASRAARRGQRVSSPTWTGRSGNIGAPAVGNGGGESITGASVRRQQPSPRFGTRQAATSRFGANGSGAAPPLTSASLLSTLRERNPASSSGAGAESTAAAPLASRQTENTARPRSDTPPIDLAEVSPEDLVAKVREYLSDNGTRATSASIVRAFNLRIRAEHVGTFRTMLQAIADFEKRDGIGWWRLKLEFQ